MSSRWVKWYINNEGNMKLHNLRLFFCEMRDEKCDAGSTEWQQPKITICWLQAKWGCVKEKCLKKIRDLNVECLKKKKATMMSCICFFIYAKCLHQSFTSSTHFFFFITAYSAVTIAGRLQLVPAALGEGSGCALGRLGSSLGRVETNNHTQICTHIRLMCMYINISLMCICSTTQNEHGKWTRDFLAANRHATVASCITHSALVKALRVKQSARNLLISLRLNHSQIKR